MTQLILTFFCFGLSFSLSAWASPHQFLNQSYSELKEALAVQAEGDTSSSAKIHARMSGEFFGRYLMASFDEGVANGRVDPQKMDEEIQKYIRASADLDPGAARIQLTALQTMISYQSFYEFTSRSPYRRHHLSSSKSVRQIRRLEKIGMSLYYKLGLATVATSYEIMLYALNAGSQFSWTQHLGLSAALFFLPEIYGAIKMVRPTAFTGVTPLSKDEMDQIEKIKNRFSTIIRAHRLDQAGICEEELAAAL